MTAQPTTGPDTGFDLGGGGGTSFSWGKPAVDNLPGLWVQGTVLDMKEVQKTNYETNKPEFWDNGDPVMQYRVTLQTELRDPADPGDNGQRDIYLDGRRRPNDNGTKSKLCAVLDAVREATGGTHLQRGGKLTLQWVSGMGFSGDPRCFTAWYEAPTMQLGGTPPGVAQPPVAPPVQQVAPRPAVQPQSVQQTIATQGPPPTFAQPAAQQPASQAPPAPPVQQAPVAQAAPPQAGPTPETIAALRAAGVDPATVYPGWSDNQSPVPAGQPG